MADVLVAARSHADACAPRESCGLIIQAESGMAYIACRNMAQQDDEFLIAPEDWADAEEQGQIVAVVHSHPGQEPPVPSEVDLANEKQMGLPWIIVGAQTVHHSSLVGLPFQWGVHDCYTLVRDWYRISRGEELPDWEHEADFWERGKSPFIDHYHEAGFYPVQFQELKQGDVVLMRVASTVPNHSAVYLGGGLILHHLMHRKSCIEPLAPWLRRVAGVYRRVSC